MDKYHLILLILDRLTDDELRGLDQAILNEFLETFMRQGKGVLDTQKILETSMREFIANH